MNNKYTKQYSTPDFFNSKLISNTTSVLILIIICIASGLTATNKKYTVHNAAHTNKRRTHTSKIKQIITLCYAKKKRYFRAFFRVHGVAARGIRLAMKT